MDGLQPRTEQNNEKRRSSLNPLRVQYTEKWREPSYLPYLYTTQVDPRDQLESGIGEGESQEVFLLLAGIGLYLDIEEVCGRLEVDCYYWRT